MPDVIVRTCPVCQEQLEPIMASLGMMSHPGCSVEGLPEEQHNPASINQVNPFDDSATRNGYIPLPELAQDLQAEFTTMIRWHEEFTPRSQQLSLGPSDLGTECDRELAYKIAGIRGYNHGDPWPGFVGSSIHARLGDVIRAYAKEHGGAWLIENRVVVDPLISGHADIVRSPLVVDFKSGGKDVIDRARKEGPSHKYLVQIHSYAKGLIDAGHPITQVALVYLPRAGWLRDMYVWAAPYDPKVPIAALTRAYGIARHLKESDIRNNPDLWETIVPTPGFGCTWCGLFNKEMGPDEPATDKGCAGWNIKRGAKK